MREIAQEFAKKVKSAEIRFSRMWGDVQQDTLV